MPRAKSPITCPHCQQTFNPPKKSDGREFVKIEGKIIKVTEKAVLISYMPTGAHLPKEVFIPRSQLHDGQAVKEGDDKLRCRQWFAEKEHLKAREE